MPLAKALVQRQHQVTILALHHDYARLRHRAFTQAGVSVRYVGQMHVRKVDSHKLYYRSLGLLVVSALATLRLTWAALRTPSDAIHICKTQPMNGTAAWLVHTLRGTSVYLDSDDYEAANNRFGAAWQQRVVAWFEDWMPSFASGITANTTFIADRFQQLGYPAAQIHLVPNAVDRARFEILEHPDLPQRLVELRQSLGISIQNKIAVYVGSLSTTSHALDLLLDAWVEVTQREPDAYLLLVGGGEELKRLQKRTTEMGLSEKVRYTGMIVPEQVPLYYQLGDVTVDPMRDSLPARSSLSLKLLESIVSGVPCVTADIGDRKGIVGACGIAVPPADPHALAEGILSVLQDPRRAASMRAAAASVRESHYWDVRVDAFLEAYT